MCTFVILLGDSYVVLNDNGIAPGYPRLISSYWPGAPRDIDAALYWEDLDQTYFFKVGRQSGDIFYVKLFFTIEIVP